jgi:hypothetical protein
MSAGHWPTTYVPFGRSRAVIVTGARFVRPVVGLADHGGGEADAVDGGIGPGSGAAVVDEGAVVVGDVHAVSVVVTDELGSCVVGAGARTRT